MADTVTSRYVANGARNLIMRFTNVSDGTGESGVVKVDATNVVNGYQGVAPGVNLKVQYINWSVTGTAAVRLRWQATADEDAFAMSYNNSIDFAPYGLLKAPPIAGVTGSLKLTTIGFGASSAYDILIVMAKGVPQI
jgi:hypothetical protein